MDILTIDFETYYGSDFTLSNMNSESYIRDPRFEVILVAVKFDDQPASWLLPDRFDYFVRNEVDWSDTAVIAHNAAFDGLILSHHYAVRPAMWIDTLSCARALDGPKAGNSLHDLAIRHGIGMKGTYVTTAKGKRLKDFTNAELHQYGEYCCQDANLTYDLAQIFLPQMPADELRLVDLTIRFFTEPVFIGNAPQLRAAVASERARKIELLRGIGLICGYCNGTGTNLMPQLDGTIVPCKKCDGLGVDKKPLGSNPQFADLLRKQGVEPETKTSPTTGEQIFAFAKSDSHMAELLEDDDENVRALADARLCIKSNIIETRAERYAGSAERGPMPVGLNYCGAHTLRWSGSEKMNWQNLSGEKADRPEMSIIKASIQAPPGYSIVVTDSGQGEARITAWNAGQHDLVEAFAQGRDVYSEYASSIFGRPITKADKKERALGKASILGLGFGMGWNKFAGELLKGMLGNPPIQFVKADLDMLQVDPSRFLNSPKKVAQVQAMLSRLEFNDRAIHCVVAESLVVRYRKKYPKIPEYWTLMESVINAMIRGETMVFGANGNMRTEKDAVLMSNGMKLHYRGIERDQQSGDATYWDGRKRTKIHGPMITENTTQCTHRILVAGQMLEISDALKVALMTHDDIATVVPSDAAPMALEFMLQTMKKTPPWAAGLPLMGEGGIGQTLLEAK